MRSRNLREMRLGTNLVQDREGHWLLEFRGTQLKVAKRAGRTNEYLFDLTIQCPPEHDDLLPALEEFLTVYRPRLPNSTPDGFVFLTQLGTPYDGAGLRKELATIVARYTGQRFFPHMIRSIWGSEYLDDHPGDFTTVAEMLGQHRPRGHQNVLRCRPQSPAGQSQCVDEREVWPGGASDASSA